MKNFILIALVISLFTDLSSAQKWEVQKMPAIGVVSGIVIDDVSGKPVQYASVTLIQQQNDEIITGGITNEDGMFEIREVPSGRYMVTVEFIGYEKITIESVKISPGKGNSVKKNLGVIKMSLSAVQMEELTVIGDLPEIVHTSDKLIYVVDKSLTVQGGTAEDVLNNVPMVTVDQDGEVSLRGNPNVKLLVNGRPNRTGHESNNVDNIPASLIEKVEVITSPSAKYDPEGMAGIINIVLKKDKYEGLNGTIKLNGKHNSNNSFNDLNGLTAYGNYKREKWNIYSSYNLNNRIRKVDGYRGVYTTYLATDSSNDSIYFTFDDEADKQIHSFQLGTDYSINEQLILNGELNYRDFGHTGIELENNYYDEEGDYLSELTQRKVNEIDFGDNYNIEGIFEINKTYDNPDREFNFSISNEFKKHQEYEILNESTLDSTSIMEEFYSTEIDLSYKHPLNDKSNFQFGYDGKYKTSDEKMNFQIHDEGDSLFTGINKLGYHRNIHGLFIEFDQKLNESFSIKPGLRYEYVDKNISFNSVHDTSSSDFIYAEILNSLEDSTYIDDYFSLYPSLHLTYNISEKKSFQFSMSRRVNRPGSRGHGGGSRQIRPFPRDVYSESFIFMGNPFLKPEYSNQYELSFKSPIPMGFAYLNLYYHQLEDVIEWYDDDRYENSDVLTFWNADSGKNMGFEFFTMIMGQTFGGGYNLSKLDDPSGDYELNGNSQRFMLYNRISLPEKYIKLFSFEFGFFFMKITVPGGDLFGSKGTLWANTALSKSFMDESITFSLGINNLFDSGGFRMKRTKPLYDDNGIKYASEFTDVETHRGGRTFTLSIKYNFGQMQEEKRNLKRTMERGNEGEMDMGY